MKRAGNLFPGIVEMENLRLAAWKALRHKRGRADARAFSANLDRELADLRAGLLRGDVPLGGYHEFTIHDPKERRICAPCFRERVLHHALMNVLEPVLDGWLIAHTYACRRGKGQWAALDAACRYARRHEFYLKCDVRKYFPSIPKARVLKLLGRRIKDRAVLELIGRILTSHEPEKDRGLPIGSLTSQHLANFYLGWMDRFVKERLRCPGYVRYMDDFTLWAGEKTALRDWRDAVIGFATGELGLEIKPPHLGRTRHGMDFLGHRVRPGWMGLNRRSRRRFAARCREITQGWESGAIPESVAQDRMTAAAAFTRHAACHRWRARVIHGSGDGPRPFRG